ncbi:MAG: alpha/beta hydrolase [Polyangiaceae bacterium]|nr:alpha/beta hydrolase [Polyangiaceae bacterium]
MRLMCVQHSPAEPMPVGAAVLLAGFSHPMCDVDYFMSRLARELARSGLFVAQVDPRGHGDSAGELADVDLDTLREDIALAADHYSRRFPGSLLCIGRGLIATLLAEASGAGFLLGVAGVAPYCLDPEVIREHLRGVPPGAREKDASDVFPGDDYVDLRDFSDSSRCALHALGAVPYNLHGARLSGRLLRGLCELDALSALRRADAGSSLWLLPDGKEPADLTPVELGAASAYPPPSLYRDEPLPRSPALQRTVIERLTQWAVDRCAMS